MAKRGQKPTPNHLKVVTGSHRARHDADAPPAEPVGDPPADWTPGQKQHWWDLVNAAPEGVLTKHDHLLVELGARLLSDMRQPGKPNTPALYAQLRVLLSEIGLTPAGRERIATDLQRPRRDPADHYFGGEE